MFYRPALGLAVLFVITGCSRKTETALDRVAVLPFENLSNDRSLDWFGRALSGIVATQVSSKTLNSVSVLDANSNHPTHLLRGYFTVENGQLQVTAAIRNAAKTVREFRTSGRPEEIVRLSTGIAKLISSQPQPFPSSNVTAIREYYLASIAPPPQLMMHLERAIAADPGFGSAHVARAQNLLRSGLGAEAGAALQTALSARLSEEDKAAIALLQAQGNTKARARALRQFAQARPGSLEAWRSLAEVELVNKNPVAAAAAYQSALAIDPANISFWNQLGYSQAFGGNLEAAKASFEQYRRLAPNDANAIDSLGEVHFRAGKFEEAERYFLDAFQRNNALIGGGDLYRAALSRLLLGDASKANEHFSRYLDFRKRAGDPLLPVRDAIWKFSTGRRQEAIRQLQASPHPAGKFFHALCLLQTGEAAGALGITGSLQNPQMTGTIRALALPAANVPADNLILRGHSLLLQRKFAEATSVWRQIYDSLPATAASEAQLFLAWALMESGQDSEAASLLTAWPLPPASPEPNLTVFSFPRVLFLKARAEANSGRRAEAERYYKLFLQYSGNLPLAFEEESRARRALGMT